MHVWVINKNNGKFQDMIAKEVGNASFKHDYKKMGNY